MKKFVQIFGVALMAGATLLAQGPGPGPHPGRGPGREFPGGRMFPGKVVTGSPYSAQVVRQTTQTLPDGSTVSHSNTETEYRDGMGRERKEQNLSNIGPWSVQGTARQMVFISDPVGKMHYTLDPTQKTARKMAMAQGRNHEADGNPPPPPGGGMRGARGSRDAQFAAKTDQLGTQTIEGVAATGTRHTITIPAGAMGNSNAIQVVEERWYSSELQMVVMSKHTDPRFGTTTFQMTNITRAEPDPALFTVPSGYSVKESPEFRRGPRPPANQ